MHHNPDDHLVIITIGPAIVAMDRVTGARVWQHRAEGVFYDRISVTDDHVLAAGGSFITRLAYATGALVYTVESPVSAHTWLVDSGQIFLSHGGELACLAADTGRLLWHDRFKGFGQLAAALGVPGNVSQVDQTG